jgi:hypothetical protein
MPDEISSALERIREKLDRLRRLDTLFSVFGSGSHRYLMGQRLTNADLKSLERQLGATLPLDYRQFLMEVGHGGAGPCYGLFTLDSQDPENVTSIDDLARRFEWEDAFNPAEWEEPSEHEGVECDEDGGFLGLSLPGALYLCHCGCALRVFLVVNGTCNGEVWHDWQADGAGIYPATDSRGRRVRFANWYEEWLDRSLVKIDRPP